MLNRIKKALGIEGVKLQLTLTDKVSFANEAIKGKIIFYSLSDQVVESVDLTIKERYKRGRRKKKLIDEYTLGELTLNGPVDVEKEQEVEVDFELPVKWIHSAMERFGRKNWLTRRISGGLSFLKGAKSRYYIEAEAKVQGVKLDPFDRLEVYIQP